MDWGFFTPVRNRDRPLTKKPKGSDSIDIEFYSNKSA